MEGKTNSAMSSLTAATLLIACKSETHFISKSKILFCKANGAYTEIHFVEKKKPGEKTITKVLACMNIKAIEQKLCSPVFLRCHRSYIVNLRKVVKHSGENSGQFILDNGVQIPVSDSQRHKVAVLLKQLKTGL